MPGRYDEEARLKEQVGLLVGALHSDSERMRESAIVQVTLLGTKAAPILAATLIGIIDESDGRGGKRDTGRETAIEGIVRSLGIMADPSTVSVLAKALPRPEAVMALAKVGTSSALTMLIQEIPRWYERRTIWKDGTEENTGLAKAAFAYFGQEGVTRLGEAATASSDITVALCACVIFQEAKGASAIGGLLNLLESSDLKVRTASFQALSKIGATIPQQLVTKALERALKRPVEERIDVPFEQLLDACQEDTLLQFYFGWEWEEPPNLGPHSSAEPSQAQQVLELHIVKNPESVKPKLISYVESGNPSQQRLAARLLERVTAPEIETAVTIEPIE